ncbi:sialate O-acetylesterase [Pseudoalteromonas sp. MB41]|uniref:sialate O-acetylesterase n=1 Tax=Pseudoalteromonas sp. MB41 TaxID=2896366 RepID=UPI001E5C2711|nr:sialate O-acetylesterase [Pseudoalteromonas sp. MB41]MCC9662898.1 sialate O-acetylesterase [Pseudoalteromonas sp. MB41]
MASFFSLVTELETLLGQLNIILSGDENTSVSINGVEKPSIQKKTLDEITAKVQLVLDAAADIDAVKYATTSAGIAATNDGQFFSVVSDSEDKYLDLYKNESGTAVFKKSYPSLESLKEINKSVYSELKEDYAYIVIDEQNKVAFAIDKEGFTHTVKTYTADVITKKINGIDTSNYLNNISNGNFESEMNGVASYGQSLSAGFTKGQAVISNVQHYDSLMFSGGVRAYDSGTDPSVIYSSLLPLVESVSGNLGETPLSGMTQNIKELIAAENKINYTEQNYQLLASAAGESSKGLSQLSKGTAYYSRLMADIEYGRLRAGEQNKSYSFQSMIWMQGEADYSVEALSDKTAYKSNLAALVNDVIDDSMLITMQSTRPKIISYQVGSHLKYFKQNNISNAEFAPIAQAQLELSVEHDDFILAMPMYQFDYLNSTNEVHLTSKDSKVAGAYLGVAYKREVIDGKKFVPLKPIAFNRSRKSINIKMHVPYPPLVFDTDWVSQNQNYGFRVFDNAGVQLSISNVEILNKDIIKITMQNEMDDNPITVDYALFSDNATGEVGRNEGARGNVRDSQGSNLIFDENGLNQPLHNWLVMFSLKEGELSWL